MVVIWPYLSHPVKLLTIRPACFSVLFLAVAHAASDLSVTTAANSGGDPNFAP